MVDVEHLLKEFMGTYLKNNPSIEIYNEISLQFELGIFLRKNLPDYRIQFEKNVSSLGISGTVKKEIDIVILSKDEKEKYAVELKYPRNGQYPEDMYQFVKDIRFMEEVKEKSKGDFKDTFVMTLVDESDKLYYSGDVQKGDKGSVYQYFRINKGECEKAQSKIRGRILRPIDTDTTPFYDISGEYQIDWEKGGHKDWPIRYYILRMQ